MNEMPISQSFRVDPVDSSGRANHLGERTLKVLKTEKILYDVFYCVHPNSTKTFKHLRVC